MSTGSRTGTMDKPKPLKSGRWAIRVKWISTDGTRESETVYGATEAEARRLAARRLDTKLREVGEEKDGLGGRKKSAPCPLEEAALKVADEVLPLRQRVSVQATTLARLVNWWLPEFGKTPLDQIGATDIRRVLAAHRQKGSTPATCNRSLSALSVVFEWAVEAELMKVNPCRARNLRQREGLKIPRVLTAEEAGRLLEAADPEWRPLFATALYAGLRLGELQGLRWGDLEFDRNRLIIRHSHGGDPKSGHHRVVPMHIELKVVLMAEERGGPEELVFASRRRRNGRAPDAEKDPVKGPRKALQRAAEKAGLDKRPSMHDLRHTFATLAVEHGVSPRTLQHWLGHGTLAMTARYVSFSQGSGPEGPIPSLGRGHEADTSPSGGGE